MRPFQVKQRLLINAQKIVDYCEVFDEEVPGI